MATRAEKQKAAEARRLEIKQDLGFRVAAYARSFGGEGEPNGFTKAELLSFMKKWTQEEVFKDPRNAHMYRTATAAFLKDIEHSLVYEYVGEPSTAHYFEDAVDPDGADEREKGRTKAAKDLRKAMRKAAKANG